mgnify:CR=1 FL=1
MGTFAKKMRKQTLKQQFERSKMLNNYLMQRVSTLMDQVPKEQTIEELNQERMNHLMSVTA